jgi:hypothetical protein
VDCGRALTPLHAACGYKLPNAARFFLELGDDLRAKDADGKSPLHHALSGDIFACYHGNGDGDAVFDTVTVLSEFGVKLESGGMGALSKNARFDLRTRSQSRRSKSERVIP